MTIAIDVGSRLQQQAKTNQLYDLIQRTRDRLVNPKPGEPSILAKFGWMVIDHLGLVSSEILPAHSSPEAIQARYEEMALRYLDVVLPDPNDMSVYDALAIAELIAAINPEQPEPGRLTAAYGTAHMDQFGKDLRLIYRVGAYRGKPGNPLTDFLISKILHASDSA